MRWETNWVMCLAAAAATLTMSVAAGRTASADWTECDRISQQDAQIGCYTRYIEDHTAPPRSRAGAYAGRSGVFFRKGEYESAAADATNAIEIDPKYERAYFARGLAYHFSRKLDQAIVDYTRAIDLAPMDANALINRALLYDRKGESDRAIREFDEILAKNSAKRFLSDMGRSYAYLNRGLAHINRSEFDQAIADSDRAIEINPKLAFAYHYRGLAYRGKGKFGSAIAEFKRAIELDPKVRVHQSELLRTYVVAGAATLTRLRKWVVGEEKRAEVAK